MAVFIGGIRGYWDESDKSKLRIRVLTQQEYAKLRRIEDSALKYWRSLKNAGYYDSKKLSWDYYSKWDDLAEQLGILVDYRIARYKVQGMKIEDFRTNGYEFYELFPF